MRWDAMMKRTALPLLALAACGQPNPANQSATAAAEQAGPAVNTSPVAASAAVQPVPGELKTFSDWTVACDNGARCEMGSLLPESGLPGDAPVMMIAREAGPAGPIEITLQTGNDADGAASIVIDGRSVAEAEIGSDGALSFSGAEAVRITGAMVNGGQLMLKTLGSERPVSLKGSAAAMRYVDAGQDRAGTVTAWVASGARPQGSVPPARALPIVTALAAPRGNASAPDAAETKRLRGSAGCDEEYLPEGLQDAEAHLVGPGQTLVLVACGAGAYNSWSVPFIVANGRTEMAKFDVDATGMNPDSSVPQLVNAGFDDGVLSSFAKGRGLGDCGVSQAFVWDGTRFRLIGQSEMGECRGNPNWITTWRAQVKRR
jgi:hypothetical protein